MKSYLLLLFLGFSSLIQSQNKPLLLHKYLKIESQYFSKFGNESDRFVENNKAVNPKIVLQDFEKIKKLTSINTAKYEIKAIKKGKHLVTIYKSGSKVKPYKIIEVITRDTTEYMGNKIHLEHVKYFILSKNNPQKVEVNISENGISSYTIDAIEKIVLEYLSYIFLILLIIPLFTRWMLSWKNTEINN